MSESTPTTLDIMEMLQECEEKLVPTPIERLMQIVTRLTLHYRQDEAEQKLQSTWIAALSHYPEDLLCAAYMHLVKHRSTMPSVEDFITFIEPEMQHRTLTRKRLQVLVDDMEAA